MTIKRQRKDRKKKKKVCRLVRRIFITYEVCSVSRCFALEKTETMILIYLNLSNGKFPCTDMNNLTVKRSKCRHCHSDPLISVYMKFPVRIVN